MQPAVKQIVHLCMKEQPDHSDTEITLQRDFIEITVTKLAEKALHILY